jgi:hypothetical protein
MCLGDVELIGNSIPKNACLESISANGDAERNRTSHYYGKNVTRCGVLVAIMSVIEQIARRANSPVVQQDVYTFVYTNDRIISPDTN